jgi:hypothetical protein
MAKGYITVDKVHFWLLDSCNELPPSWRKIIFDRLSQYCDLKNCPDAWGYSKFNFIT